MSVTARTKPGPIRYRSTPWYQFIGDVHRPDLIRPHDLHAAQQIGINLVPRLRLGCARAPVERLDNSPIFACSALISADGAAGAVPLPAPKTFAALASSCAFQAVIWFGWTSNCSANCASVRSPLIAAKATFALKLVNGSAVVFCSLPLLIGAYQRARCQAEIHLPHRPKLWSHL